MYNVYTIPQIEHDIQFYLGCIGFRSIWTSTKIKSDKRNTRIVQHE